MTNWQSIATAPIDGTWFLADWDGETRIAKFIDNGEMGYFCVCMEVSRRPYNAQPDGWQPFPSPQSKGVN